MLCEARIDDAIPVRASQFVVYAGVAIALALTSFGASQTQAQTRLQSSVSNAVASSCPLLGGAGAVDPGRGVDGGSALDDLAGRCTDYVVDGLATGPVLGALEEVSPADFPAGGINATDISSPQREAVGDRLGSLRAGGPRVDLRGLSTAFNMAHDYVVSPNLTGLQPSDSGLSAGDGDFSQLGLFGSGSFSFGDVDGTSERQGFDFYALDFTIGADYLVSDQFLVGAAAGYTFSDNDFDGSGGSLESNAYNLTGFATYFVDNWYVEGVLEISFLDMDTERRIVYSIPSDTLSRTASGNSDGFEIAGTIGAGYNIQLEQATVTPFAQLTELRVDIDGFTETGANGLNLRVDEQDITSRRSRLGVIAVYPVSMDFGILSPQARLEWEHEFENDSRAITSRFASDPFGSPFQVLTEDPERDTFNFSLGAAAQLAGGKAGFIEYETVLGNSDLTEHIITIGGRLEL